MERGELETVVALWHAACVDTYDFIPIERDRTIDDRRGYFTRTIAVENDLWVALADGATAGYLAIKNEHIDRLYVHPDRQRRGIGTALLARASELSPDRLTLYTHVRNTKARLFYEKHGFIPTRFGMSPPPENEPDVFYERGRPVRTSPP